MAATHVQPDAPISSISTGYVDRLVPFQHGVRQTPGRTQKPSLGNRRNKPFCTLRIRRGTPWQGWVRASKTLCLSFGPDALGRTTKPTRKTNTMISRTLHGTPWDWNICLQLCRPGTTPRNLWAIRTLGPWDAPRTSSIRHVLSRLTVFATLAASCMASRAASWNVNGGWGGSVGKQRPTEVEGPDRT